MVIPYFSLPRRDAAEKPFPAQPPTLGRDFSNVYVLRPPVDDSGRLVCPAEEDLNIPELELYAAR